MVMQCAALPVFATQEDTTAATGDTSAATEQTTAPIEKDPTVPQDYEGDASVEYGCKTLDAKVPLADTSDYTAKAKGAIAYDVNSDTLIWAQDADVKLYPASLTKIMTALLTLENVTDLDAIVTVRGETIRGLDPTGSNAALKNGEEMSVRNLLYCLMIASANDAAMVLAEYVAGDVDSFVVMMNEKAQQLGCTGTHFANPHGLHDDDHYTTARDMAKIMAAALENPVFVQIDSTASYTVPGTNLSESRNLTTTNRMMYQTTYPNVYDSRVVSGKTGYTSAAGRCLVAVSESGSMKLITVVLGCNATYGSDGYSFVRYGNFEETSDLLDFVYGNFTSMQVLSQDSVLGDFEVSGGANHAYGEVSRTVRAVVPKGTVYQDVEYDYSLNGKSLKAPLEKGDTIGAVRVMLDGLCIAQETLYAAAKVEKDGLKFSGSTAMDTFDAALIWKGGLIVLAAVLVIAVLGVIRRNLRLAAQRKKRRRRRPAAARSSGQPGAERTRTTERSGTDRQTRRTSGTGTRSRTATRPAERRRRK